MKEDRPAMKKDDQVSEQLSNLRCQADKIMQLKPDELQRLSAEEIHCLIHEMGMYQTNLQMHLEGLHRAREKTEESLGKYTNFFDFAPAGYFIFDQNGLVLEVNHTGASQLGQEKVNLINQSFSTFVAQDHRDMFLMYLKQVFQHHQVRQICELKLKRNNGTEFCARLESIGVRDEQGNFSHYRTIVSNISKRKSMEEELQRTQKLKFAGVMAGDIAHEFKNIITIIVSVLSLAKLHLAAEDKVLGLLEQAENAAVRAGNLTRQLQTFFRSEAPVKKITSLLELLKNSVNCPVNGPKVTCEFSLPDDLWPVEIDERQIGQVINTLITNAGQAMPDGGEIKVSAENVVIGPEESLPLKDGKYVRVSIKDQGWGLQKEDLQRVFDPCFSSKAKESGLGLVASYLMIRKHGGYLGAESELGAGTTFSFYLPAARKRTLPSSRNREQKSCDGRRRILLMEDEVIVRSTAGQMLEYFGYQVEFAWDGVEALSLYKQAKESGRPFHVVIMDLSVPGGMGGMEAIQELRRIDPDVKAIISSGYSDDLVMSEFKRYGFTAAIAKPYQIQELAETLQCIIDE
jgi:two-component system cell cycle sensor histidine kinase/response regulator CckA